MGLRGPFGVVAASSRDVAPGTWGGGAELWARWGGRPRLRAAPASRAGKVGCPRGGPGDRACGKRRGVRKRALDGRGMLQRRLPWADFPWATATWLPHLRASKGAEARSVGAAVALAAQARPSMAEKAPKQLLSPDLCTSRGLPLPPLPPPCACVYSSPSRRTPTCGRANPENRILRKTQEVRQTI